MVDNQLSILIDSLRTAGGEEQALLKHIVLESKSKIQEGIKDWLDDARMASSHSEPRREYVDRKMAEALFQSHWELSAAWTAYQFRVNGADTSKQ